MSRDSIYRVSVRSTGSVQPGCGSYWQSEVIYCGPSLRDARVAYLRSEAEDYWRGHGNAARETLIERHEAEPEDIETTECERVEA